MNWEYEAKIMMFHPYILGPDTVDFLFQHRMGNFIRVNTDIWISPQQLGHDHALDVYINEPRWKVHDAGKLRTTYESYPTINFTGVSEALQCWGDRQARYDTLNVAHDMLSSSTHAGLPIAVINNEEQMY